MSRSDAAPLRARSGGFSLIEILLVLAVIGVSMGAVVLNSGSMAAGERLKASVRKLAGLSDFIRSHAAGTQRSCFLDVDFDKHRYRFRQEPMKDSMGRYTDPDGEYLLSEEEVQEWIDGFEWTELPRDVYFKALFISEKHFFSKGEVEVEYYPNGTLQSYVLHIQGKLSEEGKPRGFSVIVSGLTGKSEVKEGFVKFPKATDSDFGEVMSGAPGASSGERR